MRNRLGLDKSISCLVSSFYIYCLGKVKHKNNRIQKKLRKKRLKYLKLTHPLFRKVYPKLLPQELVDVQPMAAPTGVVFNMVYCPYVPMHTTTIMGDKTNEL